jgi:hypothetical protein
MKYRILILSKKGKQYISYDIDNKNIKKVMMDDFTSCNHVVFGA